MVKGRSTWKRKGERERIKPFGHMPRNVMAVEHRGLKDLELGVEALACLDEVLKGLQQR